jgi:hypothetical protein
METVFDIATVGCFLIMALAYFKFASRDLRTLMHLMIPGAALAVANQVGNAGYLLLGGILILAALCYAAIVIRQSMVT